MLKKYICFILGAMLLPCCSGHHVFTAYRKTSETDFLANRAALYYQKADEISLKIYNNDEFIDFVIETNSPLSLQKIYNLGLCFWLDPNGKSRNVFAIHFPLPSKIVYTNREFQAYLNRFNKTNFQQELATRFQSYEIVDTRVPETVRLSTNLKNEGIAVNLSSNPQVLFCCHVQIPIKILYPNGEWGKAISLRMSNINEATEEFYSAMSNKQVIQQKMNELRAGAGKNDFELQEICIDFELAKLPD